MERIIERDLATLKDMTPSQLRAKYAELHGEPSRSGNKQWLIRRCAWRIQALAEGGLSERARRHAKELARDPPSLLHDRHAHAVAELSRFGLAMLF